jgi:DNA-binding transcriptional LysR family regulator
VVSVVEEGFDVAIRAGKLEPSSLIARRLADAGPVLCASPVYLATAAALDSMSQISDHDCLVNDQVAWGARWDFGDGHAHRIRPRFSSNSWEVLREAALAGLGVALMPDVHVSQEILAGRLVRLLPDQVKPTDGLWVMYTPHRYLSPKVRAFVDHLVRAFATQSTATRAMP